MNRLPEREYYKGTTERLESVAKATGYERRVLKTVSDSNGRRQFEIFRFTPVAR